MRIAPDESKSPCSLILANSYLPLSLDAELPQVMVNVFVHEDSPLLRLEWAEERVRVISAARGALTGKAVDCRDKPGAFALELTLCRIRRE